ncbi:MULTISPECIES: hypothetical protein [Clostridium]|uniref:hypothetical protein n=1 Tax=Clostridium TaxID=1485 RepID=UPI0011C1C78D|nr:hypothetical protein [[Clostridium] innocuum]MCQ5276556.1 hypothetical protein [Clostridium sp. DFI.1.208]MCC2844257.1 hypothetical protein [[Clostridium] innocuum]MCC2848528.1 hypothetical protein [[Clostridium] innocuum]MCC2852389.1 hypothetical protein [[Clostridium] innocuum]MCG4662093.1 hypothetical protein [[Clostridium] innocuum]
MRRRLWVLPLMYLMVMMSLGTIHAGEASSEAEVGFDVNEDSVYRLNVQVIGRGVVRDGRQYIRTSLTYETAPGVVKEFILEPEEGYRVKQVSYERLQADMHELSTDSPSMDDAATPAMAMALAEDEDVLLARYAGPLPENIIDVTDQLVDNKIEIQTESVDTKLIVVYEEVPGKDGNLAGAVGDDGNSGNDVVDTADHTDTVPYLILMLAAMLIMAERKRRLSEEEYNKQEEMKMKKTRVFTATMALTMAAGMFAMPIFATDGSNDGQGTNPDSTTVSYNNATIIENPDGAPATWGVEVPKAITFTDKISSIRADVKLVDLSADKNPGYPDAANAVTVKVKSENGYEMKLNDPDEPDSLKYTLGYEKSGAMTNAPIAKNTDFEIGKLSEDNLKIKGMAVKLSNALMTGNHTDKLIYTISTTTVTP